MWIQEALKALANKSYEKIIDGAWTVYKYSDGTFEAWRKDTLNVTGLTTFAAISGGYKQYTFGLPTSLNIATVDYANVIASPTVNFLVGVVINQVTTENMKPTIMRYGSSADIGTCYAYSHIRGAWQ